MLFASHQAAMVGGVPPGVTRCCRLLAKPRSLSCSRSLSIENCSANPMPGAALSSLSIRLPKGVICSRLHDSAHDVDKWSGTRVRIPGLDVNTGLAQARHRLADGDPVWDH